jgi:hypothetical protein
VTKFIEEDISDIAVREIISEEVVSDGKMLR